MLKLIRTLVLLALTCAAPLAVAAPCAGFNDVDDASAFCPNVEWIKNRAVTLGCGAAFYCPGDFVSRLAMAAFMNRLGTALTPVQLHAESSTGAVDLDVQPVLCQTTPFAASDYPRRAVLDGSMSSSAPSEIDIFTELAVSSDGVNWQPLNALAAPSRTYIAANRWSALSQVGSVDLFANEVVRFGIRVGRVVAGTTDLSDSRCQLRVLIFSRDGASSPY